MDLLQAFWSALPYLVIALLLIRVLFSTPHKQVQEMRDELTQLRAEVAYRRAAMSDREASPLE